MKRNLWAIADLHLGFSTGKWMDRFGEHWVGHHEKVRRHWLERIGPDDLVLLPGDFSWAMKPSQVEEELRWLRELPGTMVLIKGNHDYWWPKSQRKMAELLPEGIHALKKTAAIIDGWPLVGVRGCDLVPFGSKTEADIEKELEREVAELRASLDHLEVLRRDQEARHPPVALFHYPPFGPGERESIFTKMIVEAGCEIAVYGHLHTREDWNAYFQGQHGGVRYHLVACDALDFQPLHLAEWEV